MRENKSPHAASAWHWDPLPPWDVGLLGGSDGSLPFNLSCA
jgi:hypothetical protein